MKFSVIILAAGKGERTGLKYNKVFQEINGKKIIDYSIDFFENYEGCTEKILVTNKEDFPRISSEYFSRFNHIITGGKTRQESVEKAINVVSNNHVLIHDGARPFLPSKSVHNLVKELQRNPAVSLGLTPKESVFRMNNHYVTEVIDRSTLVSMQTPQGFDTELLKEAHKKAKEVNYFSTDDTSLMLDILKISPRIIEGDYRNIKFTTLEDLELLEVILK